MKCFTLLKNGKISMPQEIIEKLGLKDGDGLILRLYCLSKDRWQIIMTSNANEVIDEL